MLSLNKKSENKNCSFYALLPLFWLGSQLVESFYIALDTILALADTTRISGAQWVKSVIFEPVSLNFSA